MAQKIRESVNRVHVVEKKDEAKWASVVEKIKTAHGKRLCGPEDHITKEYLEYPVLRQANVAFYIDDPEDDTTVSAFILAQYPFNPREVGIQYNGKPLTFGEYVNSNEHVMYIWLVCGRKGGRAVIMRSLMWARDHNARYVTLHAAVTPHGMKPLTTYYPKFGFRPTNTRAVPKHGFPYVKNLQEPLNRNWNAKREPIMAVLGPKRKRTEPARYIEAEEFKNKEKSLVKGKKMHAKAVEEFQAKKLAKKELAKRNKTSAPVIEGRPVVWARYGSYPYWPATLLSGRDSEGRMEVLFFEKKRRLGWVPARRVMTYKNEYSAGRRATLRKYVSTSDAKKILADADAAYKTGGST